MSKRIIIIFIIHIFSISFAEEKNFVILIPSYKNAKYYKQNLDSVFKQNHKNYRVIYIDDDSPPEDNTGNLVEAYKEEKKQSHRFTLIKNNKRQLALANIYQAILLCQDNEIVVMLDGDDELANENVLSYLNKVYNDENVWITYGNFKYLSSNTPCEYDATFPEKVIQENQFREYPHGLTHLRTFYAWLFKKIKIEDLFFGDYFFKMAPDVAMYLPMIEMAGERHKYIKEVLYIYNDNNPLNEHKICVTLQHHLNNVIRSKEKYSRISSKPTFKEKNDNSKKIDLIIYLNGNNCEDLLEFYSVKFNRIFLIIDSFDTENNLQKITSKYKNIILINRSCMSEDFYIQIFKNIFDNGADYIMFLDKKIIDFKDINLSELIKLMDIAKVNCFLLCSQISDKLDNFAKIQDNVFVIFFNKMKMINSTIAAIYKKEFIKKKEIEKMEFEWRFLNWNKVCLFSIF